MHRAVGGTKGEQKDDQEDIMYLLRTVDRGKSEMSVGLGAQSARNADP